MIVGILNIAETQESILAVVIEKDNFDRMVNADPITLESAIRGGSLPPVAFPGNFTTLIAYETDHEEILKRAKENNPLEFIRWLERGRQWVEGKDGKANTVRIR